MLESLLNQQLDPVIDSNGVRWFRCKFCGKIAPEKAFWVYGGVNSRNLGVCFSPECIEKNRKIQDLKVLSVRNRRKKICL